MLIRGDWNGQLGYFKVYSLFLQAFKWVNNRLKLEYSTRGTCVWIFQMKDMKDWIKVWKREFVAVLSNYCHTFTAFCFTYMHTHTHTHPLLDLTPPGSCDLRDTFINLLQWSAVVCICLCLSADGKKGHRRKEKEEEEDMAKRCLSEKCVNLQTWI